MSGVLRGKNRKNLDDESQGSLKNSDDTVMNNLEIKDDSSSGAEIYATEVLNALVIDNIPPTPNNFSLYFDRLLEGKSEVLRKQILSMLELEESNDDEKSIQLEQSLKLGFTSVKNILGITASLYKNMALMSKILDKRKEELSKNAHGHEALKIVAALEGDVSKLNTILKTQSAQMKGVYDDTAAIVKNVENETIFDGQYGVYNKRYLLMKIEQEIDLVQQFKHKSTLIMIELSRDLKSSVKNEKAITLMTRTIARLLLKTSRRSDIVAHYGNGVFSMLLKHTDIESAKKASERLAYLVSNSNFFLADREIRLKISIGITEIYAFSTVEETVVCAFSAIEKAYGLLDCDYAVLLKE